MKIIHANKFKNKISSKVVLKSKIQIRIVFKKVCKDRYLNSRLVIRYSKKMDLFFAT